MTSEICYTHLDVKGKVENYLNNPTRKNYIKLQASYDVCIDNIKESGQNYIQNILDKKEYKFIEIIKSKIGIFKKISIFFRQMFSIDQKGLRNLGNTCFINSALLNNFLIKSKEVDFLLNKKIPEDADNRDLKVRFQRTIKNLREAYFEKQDNSSINDYRTILYLNEIKNFVNMDNGIFPKKMKISLWQQNDTMEFLDSLEEILSNEDDTNNQFEISKRKNESSIFEGMPDIRKTVDKKTHHFNNFDHIIYPTEDIEFNKIIQTKINENKEEFGKEHLMNEKNSETVFTGKAPETLCFSIGRKNMNGPGKNTHKIENCVNNDIRVGIENKKGHSIDHYYRLESAIVHESSAWYNLLSKGHYVVYIRGDKDFIKISDKKETHISKEEAEKVIEKYATQVRLKQVENPVETAVDGEKN